MDPMCAEVVMMVDSWTVVLGCKKAKYAKDGPVKHASPLRCCALCSFKNNAYYL
jgi:hypothetical protein